MSGILINPFQFNNAPPVGTPGARIIVTPYVSGYAYVHISDDLGNTWSLSSHGNTNPYSPLQAAVGADGNKLGITRTASATTYPFYSVNGGSTWANVTNGGSSSTGFFISPDGNTMYNIYIAAMYKSTNNGASWSAITSTGSGQRYGIAASTDGTILYNGRWETRYISKSTNGGTSWSALATLTTNTSARLAGVACSSDGNYVFVPMYNESNPLYRSTNGGSTWGAVTISGVTGGGSVDCDSTGQYVLFFSNQPSWAVYLSTDYGATFNAISGITSPYSGRSKNVSNSGQYMVIPTQAAGGYFYVSSDYGASWSTITIPALSSYALRAVAVNDITIY